jgi:hypothetical protein
MLGGEKVAGSHSGVVRRHESQLQATEPRSVDAEIVQRNPADTGFVVQPTRWRVEQTFGILMYESLTSTSESRVYWAITAVTTRRLTGATTTTWRET